MIKIDGKIYSEMPKSDEFAMATNVRLVNLPQVTALPDMPMATNVWLYNLPQVTALPDMPMATICVAV
jgi:hypothetical protein